MCHDELHPYGLVGSKMNAGWLFDGGVSGMASEKSAREALSAMTLLPIVTCTCTSPCIRAVVCCAASVICPALASTTSNSSASSVGPTGRDAGVKVTPSDDSMSAVSLKPPRVPPCGRLYSTQKNELIWVKSAMSESPLMGFIGTVTRGVVPGTMVAFRSDSPLYGEIEGDSSAIMKMVLLALVPPVAHPAQDASCCTPFVDGVSGTSVICGSIVTTP
mmetsp:Transcript_390/g.1081  ORF Transcript_390/g.1081 Transcript_390/m.1081 type:complete len:218 (-) Transcript_390:876-1529(-)